MLNSKKYLRTSCWLLLLTFFFMNPLVWLFSLYSDFDRSLFNLDYFVVVLLLFWFRSKSIYYLVPISVLAIFFVFIDIIAVVSTVYTFLSIQDIFLLFQYADQANIWYILIPALLFLCVVICVFIFKKIISLLQLEALNTQACLLLCLGVILLGMIEGIKFKDTSYEHIKGIIAEKGPLEAEEWVVKRVHYVFGSQLNYLYNNFTTGFKKQYVDATDNVNRILQAGNEKEVKSIQEGMPWPYPVASDNIGDSPRVLMIMLESFGLVNELDNMFKVYPQLEKLSSLGKRKDLFSFIPFQGSTISGDVREVCKILLYAPDPKFLKHFEECVPNKLKKEGYVTYSVNAWSRGMHHADSWYQKAGIDHRFFLENLPNLGRSYAYPAGRDINVLSKIGEILKKEQDKVFVYHLTVNSHFPYDKRDGAESNFQCPDDFNEELCDFSRVHDVYFSHLYNFLKDQNNLKVIIVGDHAPPFRKKVNRDYFNSSFVPSLVIEL